MKCKSVFFYFILIVMSLPLTYAQRIMANGAGNGISIEQTKSIGLPNESVLPNMVHQKLILNFSNYTSFFVVDRENRSAYEDEIEMSESAGFSTSSMIEAGNLIAANYFLTSQIIKTGNTYTLLLELAETKTATRVASASAVGTENDMMENIVIDKATHALIVEQLGFNLLAISEDVLLHKERDYNIPELKAMMQILDEQIDSIKKEITALDKGFNTRNKTAERNRINARLQRLEEERTALELRIARMQRITDEQKKEEQLMRTMQNLLKNEMVLIKGGTLNLGGPLDTDDLGLMHYKDVNPIRKVTLSNYYMSKYEVTQGEWETIMGSNPSSFSNNPASGEIQRFRPVDSISWYDALIYCNKRSVAEGLTPCYAENGNKNTVTNSHTGTEFSAVTCDWNANGYRLPTDAEWEYAARGGSNNKNQTEYAGSENIGEVAWHNNNSGKKTHQVGLKAPNSLGFYDMSGNVAEWCWDWYEYEKGKIPPRTQKNPLGPSTGTYRILRGYSCTDMFTEGYRVWFQSGDIPANRYNANMVGTTYGLRVCRSAK